MESFHSNNMDNIMMMDNMEAEMKIDNELYESGMNVLNEIYNECLEMEGGGPSRASKFFKLLFSPGVRSAFTRTIRATIRTSTGIVADVATLGVGGDVFVNSLFSIASSMSFISKIDNFIKTLKEVKSLFNKLIRINYNHKVPIFSRISIDEGFDTFRTKFMEIMTEHVQNYGLDNLSKANKAIMKIINKVTTTIADWLGCLFPDTAGLASEICKTLLDYVTNNSYDLIYKVISYLSDTMQKMITNTYALKKMIHESIKYLRDLIKYMKPQQIAQLIQSLGVRVSDLTDNSLLKGSINFGANIAAKAAKIGIKTVKTSTYLSKFSILPSPKEILVYLIDKLIIPNVNKGVELFSQLFPLYLSFSLYISNYGSIKDRLIESDPDSGQIIGRPE